MTSEGLLKKRIFQQSKEKAWDVIDEARADFPCTQCEDACYCDAPKEWFLKWFGDKSK